MTQNRAALRLEGGAGIDRLIGTPFDDDLDGGAGGDFYTGGAGLDTFTDTGGTASDTDTLVETQDLDMGLFVDTFVTGRILTDAAGTSEDDPSFRATTPNANWTVGDRWAAGATVENIKGIFEAATLTGGAGKNSFVINDFDGAITVGGVTRAVQAFKGTVTLNGAGGPAGGSERFIVNLIAGNSVQVTIADTGGDSDELWVYGTGAGDTLTLSSGRVQAAGSSTARVDYTGLENLFVFTLGGNDAVTIDGTSTGQTTVETGTGSDTIAVTAIQNPASVVLGSGDDRVTVGNVAGTGANGIDATLVVIGDLPGRARASTTTWSSSTTPATT